MRFPRSRDLTAPPRAIAQFLQQGGRFGATGCRGCCEPGQALDPDEAPTDNDRSPRANALPSAAHAPGSDAPAPGPDPIARLRYNAGWRRQPVPGAPEQPPNADEPAD